MANNTVVVTLAANIAKFQADMRTAGSATQQAMAQMKEDAVMVGMAMGAAGAAAATGLALLVQNAIQAADNLRDMSQKTGIAVETLNGLGFAANQAGGSLDSMVGAAGKLNKSIAEAAKGTPEQANAFKALGISVLDSSGNLKTADVVMAEIADKFETYADGPEKVALSMALMGKSGADMIPVLNDGGDAMRENIAYAEKYSGVTTDLANASDNFNDTMGKLQLQQQGFANTMAAAVMPILQAVAEETLQAAEESNGFSLATNAARVALQTFVVIGSEVAFTFKGVGREIGGVAAQLAAMARGDFKGAFGIGGIGDMMSDDAAKARAEHDAFIARVLAPVAATVTPGGAPVTPKGRAPRIAGGDTDKAIKAAADKQAKLIEDGKNLANGLIAQDTGLSPDFMKKWDSLSLAYGAAAISLDVLTQAQAELLSQQPMMKAMNAEAIKADIDGFKAMEDLRKGAEDEAKRNEKNVQAIAIGLMNEADQQQYAHDLVLEELQKFHDAKFENVAMANALIEQENERHEQVKADLQTSYAMQGLAMAGNSADQLYSLMEKAGMEQTALGKAVFLASKALAIAEIIINTEVAAAKATAMFPVWGSAIAMGIRVAGYASAGLVAGMAIADASAEGGYDIPAGTNPMTQLHEREMVLPKQQADVIRGLAANGGTSGAPMTLTIVNQTSGRIDKVTEQRISPTERALIIQEAVNANAAALSDPNSKASRAMGRNYAMQRSR